MGELVGVVILFALMFGLIRFMFTGRFTGRPGFHGRRPHGHGPFGWLGSMHPGENPSFIDAALTAVLGTSLIFDSASLIHYKAVRDAKHPSDFRTAMLLVAFACGISVLTAFGESRIRTLIFSVVDVFLCLGVLRVNPSPDGALVVVAVGLAIWFTFTERYGPLPTVIATAICYLALAHQEGPAAVVLSIVMTGLILALSRMIWMAMKSVPMFVVLGVLALVFIGSVGATAI